MFTLYCLIILFYEYTYFVRAGVKDIHADHAASHVGKGQGLTILLRIVGSGGGTWGLPQDLLKAAGLGPNMVAQNSTLTKDIVFKIASRAKAHIDKVNNNLHFFLYHCLYAEFSC